MRYIVSVLGTFIALSVKAGVDDNLTFNSAFLSLADGESNSLALDYFQKRNSISPGNYFVNIFLNGARVAEENITFAATSTGEVRAVLPAELMLKLGLIISGNDDVTSSSFRGVSDIFPGAVEKFYPSRQELHLEIPQIWLVKHDWLKTPPHKWNDGINALIMNYRYSGMYSRYNGVNSKSDTMTVNSSLAISGWRFRHDGYMAKSSSFNKKNNWQPINTWAYHDFSAGQGGRFSIGQLSSNDNIIEGFPFEGVNISSDASMINPWLLSFNPVIRGVATSTSRIIVKQNNTIIWEGDVPAGQFELNDITPLYVGDMHIEIRGEDGSVRQFNQTSASVPVLQHKGRLNYSLSAGRYRSETNFNHSGPSFVKASGAYGSNNDLTFYGGVLAADNYRSIMGGIGKYHDKYGAFSVDVSHSSTSFHSSDINHQSKGLSVGAIWSRGIDTTQTNLNVNGRWYSSDGFHSFNDVQLLNNREYIWKNNASQQYKLKANISQPLPEFGTLTLAAGIEGFYNTDKKRILTGLTWGTGLGPGFVSTSFNYGKSPYHDNVERSVYFSYSMPLTSSLSRNSMSISTNTFDYNGNMVIQAGVTGNLNDSGVSYGITESYRNRGKANEEAFSARYKGRYGEFQSTFTHSKARNHLLLGGAGAAVIHKGGLTLGQSLNLDGANALVDTNGVSDLATNNGHGVKTDYLGYALLPNLIPYQENELSLDVNSADTTTDIVHTDLKITPSRGALVSAKFRVNRGGKALITLLRQDGKPLPFGSVVTLKEKGNATDITAIVSDGGKVWLSGLPVKGTLLSKWGDENNQMCEAKYDLESDHNNISRISLVCE
ncbi:fimbria/pilus outer membrane usher protein [Enterobacter hormaechei]|uniref:fimbria/pilus outer membrane usher protein n=1 Tax=Enterobacter hormaechei TaxID=158836 RepID=UPI000F826D02|nr:fimbria/pilus outer membrane usher protein [Enterobacter hormaechei]RTO30630.1 fimbrial biogenesis outer membrane usher protein [Enterobacter hormaechei]HAV1476382.1 fimbrial biogenesis outer membrane usher protein [Enterobacter hormaechei subsp. steigerwaltii]HAV1694284.1 fimbrial biogenesis outer membrane usher protein [Enterobacter hormaechei subsp. steigerwaltii]HAV1738871.1 fimbrial biogenesis outer membrane usher protein [Enterobacter hormaechei subsp. steigerwaltii]